MRLAATAVRGELTAESTSEQASAGLDTCTPAEFQRFTQLNESYKRKFPFPFIMAVKGRTRGEILEAFDRRIHHAEDLEFRTALALDPTYSWGHLWIGQAYLPQGMYKEAIDEINQAIRLSNGDTRARATLAHDYAVANRRDDAIKLLDELQQLAKQRYVSPYFIALVYVGLREDDQAFAWLQKAYEEHHPYLTLLKVEPVFDRLRPDPRFVDLVRRVGL